MQQRLHFLHQNFSIFLFILYKPQAFIGFQTSVQKIINKIFVELFAGLDNKKSKFFGKQKQNIFCVLYSLAWLFCDALS